MDGQSKRCGAADHTNAPDPTRISERAHEIVDEPSMIDWAIAWSVFRVLRKALLDDQSIRRSSCLANEKGQESTLTPVLDDAPHAVG